MRLESSKPLNNLTNGQSRVHTHLGRGGVGLAAVETVDDTGGSGGESVRTEHHGAEGIARQVVQAIDGADVVLLQDAAVEDGARAGARLLGRLPEE